MTMQPKALQPVDGVAIEPIHEVPNPPGQS
jgi:hypothetical protein